MSESIKIVKLKNYGIPPLLYCKHLEKTILSLFIATAERCGKKLWDFELWRE